MWVRIDDKLPRHPKVLEAGRLIGKNGAGIALALYIAADCYCAEHLTDGALTAEAIGAMSFLVRQPHAIAEALVAVKLFERNGNGYRIHDYHDYNPTAATVKDKLARDRARKKDSTQIPRGIQADSTQIPERSRAGAGAHPLDGTGSSSGRVLDSEGGAGETTPPAIRQALTGSGVMGGTLPREHLRHAFCGRVCVPEQLHGEFVRQWGGTDADRQVRAFYAAVDDAWSTGAFADTPIGDDAWKFWRARFGERHGTTATTPAKRSVSSTPRTAGNDAAAERFLEKHLAARRPS